MKNELFRRIIQLLRLQQFNEVKKLNKEKVKINKRFERLKADLREKQHNISQNYIGELSKIQNRKFKFRHSIQNEEFCQDSNLEAPNYYQCSKCRFSCLSLTFLIKHRKTHPLCKHCNERFSSVRQLKTHFMNTHHALKFLKCWKCSHIFVNKINFEKHKRTHAAEKPFKCTMCDYASSHKGHLTRHMKTHTGEKPFKCTICKHDFSQKGHLARHMPTHACEKPFKCTICEYASSQRRHLTRHIESHTCEKPFKCTICDYASLYKGNLARHMTTHSGEKPFKCTI